MYSWITCNVSKKWLAVCVLAMAPSSFLAAQTSATGVIAGTVTDSTNAVVQHAALTLVAAGSNASRVTRSGEDGRYASIGKRTSITERVRLAFSFDMINALNRVEFADPSASFFTPASFGVITGQWADPRQIQIGLRMEF